MLKLWKKEMKTYFMTPTGYIFIGTFLLLSGIFFSITNLLTSNAIYNSLLQNIILIFILIIPILTMRIIADETRNKTDQLLLTSPIKVSNIVIGKYLAAVTVYFITILLTFLYPIILSKFGNIPFGEILAGYIGLFFMGAAFIAIGLFVSSTTENGVIAAVVTFGCMLLIYILDMAKQAMPATRRAGVTFVIILALLLVALIWITIKSLIVTLTASVIEVLTIALLFIFKKEVFDGFLIKFFEWFSLIKRYDAFSMGILDFNSIIFYLSFSAVFIFLTVQMIEKRRWS
jgi:ABC-2 type transport system permease protein